MKRNSNSQTASNRSSIVLFISIVLVCLFSSNARALSARPGVDVDDVDASAWMIASAESKGLSRSSLEVRREQYDVFVFVRVSVDTAPLARIGSNLFFFVSFFFALLLLRVPEFRT